MFALKGRIFVYFNILLIQFLVFIYLFLGYYYLNKLTKYTITERLCKLANILLQLPLQKLTIAYGFTIKIN